MQEKLMFGILILSPLVGFLINGLRYRSANYKLAGSVATVAALISFVTAASLVLKLVGLPGGERVLKADYFSWMAVGQFEARAAFLLDQISAIMVLVITGVGALIHLFSIGYMSHDERPTKYFAYLNLFLFNMLLLVLGDNLLVMFVGWEGVGLCSYLLIGFWFTDKEKAAAGMKAFITNRIGDAGFLLGIFLLFMTFGTVNFAELAGRMPSVAEALWTGPITIACLFLFVGAAGKSAQIPLYVWLPDAMAGPTPVSALIHAATMVTAGVYMIVRMNGVFIMAPNAMLVIAVIGALTAFFAATIGMTQWDIKKVLAYSTVSQLGYMFLAVGVGAFMPAMFHLMTHAFFKALMFLGSGSVIHAMHEEQDMRKMGGLRKKMPITYWTFMAGWVAIIGLPPFAGFFSKDEILWFTYSSQYGSKILWFVGLVTAALTAFYMTRLMALVFWGKSRVPEGTKPHESPLVMTLPLIVLAILSVVGGWVGIPHAILHYLPGHMPHVLEEWLKTSVAPISLLHSSEALEFILMGISVSLAAVSALSAYYLYVLYPEKPKELVSHFGKVHQWVSNKYWVDEFYFARIINPIVDLGKNLWLYIDVNFVDKLTYSASELVKSSATGLKSLQTGNMQQYAMLVALGVVATIMFVFFAG